MSITVVHVPATASAAEPDSGMAVGSMAWDRAAAAAQMTCTCSKCTRTYCSCSAAVELSAEWGLLECRCHHPSGCRKA